MGAFSLLVAIAFPMADVRITFLWFFERALLAPESYILFHAAVTQKGVSTLPLHTVSIPYSIY